MVKERLALEKTTELWVDELSRASNELTSASRQIQIDFAAATDRAIQRGDPPIPDPIKLIQRIRALEAALPLIHQACEDNAHRRREVFIKTFQRLMASSEILNQLLEAAHIDVSEQERIAENEISAILQDFTAAD